MAEFRFAPAPHRAAEIPWQPWGAPALDRAAREERLVFLNVSAVWCHWCHAMDETTLSDPRVAQLLRDQFVCIRVDADRDPHVQDRYIAGGWPTNAFLTPTGEVLWSGTFVGADELVAVAEGVVSAWRERRAELESEIGRRRSALDAARAQRAGGGLVRREPADDIATLLRDRFDARNGGFGDAPKFPAPDCIELFYVLAREDAEYARLADQTLDGMLAGELWDAADGGFFRYAAAADWTRPRHEKLLEVNAGMLESYALGAHLRDRADWRAIAHETVGWVNRTLRLESGLWGGSQWADEAYFTGARDGRAPPPIDTTVYTAATARWIHALARAGVRLAEPAWVDEAAAALRMLLALMAAPSGGLHHYRVPGEAPQHDFLLIDVLEAANAALTVAQATGDAHWLTEARRLTRHMQTMYWAGDGGFWDRLRTEHDVGALRYRERSFESNALAARLLLDISAVTGERSHRALAESTLSRLGPSAPRYGTAAGVFALATLEFFEPPPTVFVATTEGGRAEALTLRAAALRLPLPDARVWTVASGHAVGPQRFDVKQGAAAWVCTARGCSAPITDAAALRALAVAPFQHAG